MFYEFQLVRSGHLSVKEPVTAAAACEACVCTCTGNSLYVQTEQQLSVFTFEQELDATVCWKEAEYLAAAGDRSGSVHFVSTSLETVQHSLLVVPVTQPSVQPVFSVLKTALSSSGSVCLLALTVAGSVHIIHSRDGQEKEVVLVDTTQVYGLVHLCTDIYLSNLSHVLTLGHGAWPLTLWKLEKQPFSLCVSLQVSALLSDGSQLVQVDKTADSNYIVTLTKQGEICVWLAEVMVVLGVWGGRQGQQFISQFSLNSCKGLDKYFLCVLGHDSSKLKELITVLSVPELQELFSTEVSPGAVLAVSSSGEGAACLLQHDSSSESLSVDHLQYGSPEDRVAVLVSEGKFEKAEQLVQEFNLEPELVLCKKTIFLNQLVCAGKEEMLEVFLQCLTQMKDNEATVTLVLDSQYPSLATTHSVLSTVCKKLVGHDSSPARATLSALDRLETFRLISAGENFREDWAPFLRGSCLQLVTHLLQAGEVCHARLFWTRHQQAVEKELNQAKLDSLLHLIPSDLSSLPSWLPATIFPFLLVHRPHQMKEFLRELNTILCCQEQINPVNWPTNVLSVTHQLLVSFSELHSSHSFPPDISPLEQLHTKLRKLASMPAVLRHKLSFASFEQFTPTQLVYRALDQAVHQDDTMQLISGALRKFADSQQLSLDALLAEYLKLFLDRAPTRSPDFSGSPWEGKAIAVTEGVGSSKVRVICCLDLLHCISIPWSSAVVSLVQGCLQLRAPNVQQLQTLHNLLQMQIVLQEKYDIANFNFSDSSTGDVYIRHILVQQKTGVLADALWVATKYGIAHSRVYVRYLFQLCCQTKMEEARDVMKSLSPKTQASVASAASAFSFCRLNMPFSPGKSEPTSHIGSAYLALLCTNVSPAAGWSGESRPKLLRHVLELAVEFCVFISPSQLISPQHTAQLLNQTLTNLPPSSTSCLPVTFLRLAHLLGYSEHEVYCQLVKLWLQQNHTTISLSLLQLCPADLTLSLLRSALSGIQWSSLTPCLLRDLNQLTAYISSSCSCRNLQLALQVFRSYSLLHDLLLSVCVSEEEQALWPWTARLGEQGLQLEINSPLLQLSLALLQPHPRRRQGLSHLLAVVDLLQSSGHLSLAHRAAVECQLCLGLESNSNSLQSCMLEKVLSMTRVDHNLGLALLLATPSGTALHHLRTKQSSIMSSYSRSLCTLTIDYCQLINFDQVRSTASTLLTAAVWGKVLRTYQVNFWDAFRGGREEKRRVLSQMVRLRGVSPPVLLAYCRTFGLDGAGAMLTRLRLVLTEWETNFKEGFAATLVSIQQHPFIPSLLTTFLTTKVCPYDYERIQFVLQEMQLRAVSQPQHEKIQLLLSLLVEYGQRQPPSQEEKRWHAAHCHGVCRAGQDTSPHRLPLHMLLDPSLGLKLISCEVSSLSAVERFVTITHLIDLPEEKFYNAVLKSLDTSKISFDELTPLLGSVSSISTQLALTTELASRFSGTDQVAALEAALGLARDCESSPQELSFLELQLREAKTRALLKETGMDVATADPSVISTLYTKLPLQPDRPAPATVHRLVNRIADIHGVNIVAFTSHLLQECLFPSKAGRQDLNTTLVREMEEAEDRKDSLSLENWSRMVYLLTDNPHIEHLAAVLCNWANTNSPAVELSTRLCAFQLLLRAIPQSVVEKVSGASLAQLREKVQEAVFMTELASVQVALKAQVFQSCKKISIICSLLHNRGDSPKALRLAADMCLHYRLVDSHLWTKLLTALLALEMTEFLQVLLPKLVEIGAHYVASLSSVWQAVVQASYERGMGHDCLPALHLLYKCPVLFQLDLPTIIQSMTVAGAHSHAISACLLLPSSQRTSSIESVLSGVQTEKLPQLLEEVSSPSSSELLLVADEVYRYVDRKGLHESLLGSSFFPHLVQFLITHHQLSSLVTSVLSRERVSEAVQLVEMYHDHHKILAPTGVDGLKAYLKSQGLEIELCINEPLPCTEN